MQSTVSIFREEAAQAAMGGAVVALETTDGADTSSRGA